MPQQNVNLDEFLIWRWITQQMQNGGDPTIPGVTWQGQITDPAAAAAALKQSAWGQQQLKQIQAGVGFESPTSINGNTLSFQRLDNNDAIAPWMSILGPVAGAAAGGAFSGLGNGVAGGISGAAGAFGNGAVFAPAAAGAAGAASSGGSLMDWLRERLSGGTPTDQSWGVNQQLSPPGDAYDRLMTGQDMQLGTDMANLSTTGGGLSPWYAPAAAAASALTQGGQSGAPGGSGEGGTGGSRGGIGLGDAASAGSLLSRLFGSAGVGNADGSGLDLGSLSPELLQMLGRAAPGLLGAIASGNQADVLRELAKSQQDAEKARYEDLKARDTERFQTLMGREDAAIARQRGDIDFARGVTAPSRDRYESSYAPGFTMANDPGFTDALNLSSKATLNGLSVNGNPAGSPNAWAKSQEDNFSKFAYPALQNYRQLNAQTGGYSAFGGAGASVPGIGTNLSGNASAGSGVGTQAGASTATSAIGSQGNIWNSLGAAAGNVFSPPKSLADQLQEFKTLSMA